MGASYKLCSCSDENSAFFDLKSKACKNNCDTSILLLDLKVCLESADDCKFKLSSDKKTCSNACKDTEIIS